MKLSNQFRTTTTFLAFLVVAAFANPGVKHVSKSSTKFHGFLGSVMKMAGGGNLPQMETLYLQGDLQRTDHSNDKGELLTSTIIDLNREVFINIDHKKKQYSEMTFTEWKAMMEKLQNTGSEKAQKSSKADQPEVKIEFDVKVDRTNERQTIAGFDTRKAVLTMIAKGTPQSTEEDAAEATAASGSMTIISNQWLTEDVEAYDEVSRFSRKFGEKLGMSFSEGGQNFMQALSRMNPEMVKGMEKLAEESKKLQGFAVKTETTFQVEGSSQGSGSAEATRPEMPSSLKGLLGGFGKKKNQPVQQDAEQAPETNVLFESTSETVEFKTGNLSAELFSVPATYKRVEVKM